MTRGQRRVHRAIWPVLLAMLVLGVGLAVAWRPPPEAPSPQEARP